MAKINILVTLDVEFIVHEKKFSPEPELSQQYNIADHIMLIDYEQAIIKKQLTSQAGGSLNIPYAKKGDSIEWHVVSLSKYDATHFIALKHYKKTSNTKYLDEPSVKYLTRHMPIASDNENPTTLVVKSVLGDYWTAEVTEDTHGLPEDYVATFVIYDKKGKKAVGYCQWEHKITLGSKQVAD
ncbi:AidA/PixA family protein [Xenorhabdus khoisanae]|uniref:AidA/PixA family protein n=1 Tax=Xenorhabdus khoisanae TaxID=880157 RepID=UPI0023584FE1|nr:AidA/PixA family protein [Xenorhabdus khoisanae]MDC9616343.1 AidA/PixA family protein [Xenorhabdus khoisanae]